MLFEICKTVLRISVYMTGFLTCLLAVVRAIQLVFPLSIHIVYWGAVTVSIAIYSIFLVVLEIFYLQQIVSTNETVFINYLEDSESSSGILYKVFVTIEFITLSGVLIVVVLANAVSLIKVHLSHSLHRETEAAKRKATITVGIISVIYCVCNIGFVVTVFIHGYSLWSFLVPVPRGLKEVSYWILLPLNSACNPVVYLIRKEDMRSYVRELWCKFSKCSCWKKRENTESSGQRVSDAGTEITALAYSNEVCLQQLSVNSR